MKCPYCKQEECLPDVVFRHAESYGGSVSYPRCVYCKKILTVSTSIIVKVNYIKKSKPKQESSWGMV